MIPASVSADETSVTLDISQGNITFDKSGVSGRDASGREVSGSYANYIITQTSSIYRSNTITVSGGSHKITLSGVNIDVSNEINGCAFSIAPNATVNLTLTEGSNNTLKSENNCAGLQVPKGATITIDGAGNLTAIGAKHGAGIGGGNGGDGGKITISGSGTINATSKDYGAGIGGGDRGAGGEINISGSGTINATSGTDGAGIGGGRRGAGGEINISGAVEITAISENGGAGIGSGANASSNNGVIKINLDASGIIIAEGRDGGAGIGGGSQSSGGTINISGLGKIDAKGGVMAAGIGGGANGANDFIELQGGIINSIGGNSAGSGVAYGAGAGIGSGGSDNSGPKSVGTIKVNGDVVIFAKGGTNGTNNEFNGAAIGTGGTLSSGGTEMAFSSPSSRGIIFQAAGGTNGQVYGEVTLPGDLVIPRDYTLHIPTTNRITVPTGITLTNSGTLDNDETIYNKGTLAGTGFNGIIRQQVKWNLIDLTTDNNSEWAAPGNPFTFKLTSAPNYLLPQSITITRGGSPLASSDYTYDDSTGEVTIKSDAIPILMTAPFEIIAAGIPAQITTDPASLDFGKVSVGYERPAAKTVTITNNSDRDVAIALPTSENYIITGGDGFRNGVAALDPGGTATFIIQPKAGLAAGVYDTTLSLEGGGDEVLGQVHVKFTVEAVPPVAKTGDDTNMMPWLIVLLLSGSAIAALATITKRRKTNE
ncbi:MAG: hypothetical protein Q4C25_06250 [Bacillota bacterium]|nr:hypothetical protein [Bacillota bacterium]